jgi:hypothetical protein
LLLPAFISSHSISACNPHPITRQVDGGPLGIAPLSSLHQTPNPPWHTVSPVPRIAIPPRRFPDPPRRMHNHYERWTTDGR